MKQSLFSLAGIILLLAPMTAVLAQTTLEDNPDLILTSSSFEETDPEKPLQAIITSADKVAFGKNIIFDGTKSYNPSPDVALTFEWNLGDGTTATTPEVVQSYPQSGTYTVSLTVKTVDTDGNEIENSVSKEIFVYNKYMILFTSLSLEDTLVSSFINQGKESGILIDVVSDTKSTSDFEAIDVLTKNLTEKMEDISNASVVLFWTSGTTGLSALGNLDKDSDTVAAFKEKNIVYITEEALNPLSRVAQSTFSSIRPNRIILVRPEARFAVLEVENISMYIETLTKRDYEFKLIDDESAQVGVLNFMSYIINYMRDKGVPTQSIIFLLMIPVIATLVAFARQVIGLTTLGIYIPIILTLTFMTLGLFYGLTVLILIIVISSLVRKMLKRVRLLYIPRLAIILTIVSLTFLLLMFLSSLYETKSIMQISILPVIVLITLVEDFLSLQVERGFKAAVLLTLETTLVAILSFWMIEKWTAFRTLLLGYPEIIFLLIVINVLLGKYTGLRLTEVFRFRSLLTTIEHAEEE